MQVLVWSAFGEERFGVGDNAQTVTAIYNGNTGAITEATVTNTKHDMLWSQVRTAAAPCPALATARGCGLACTRAVDACRSSDAALFAAACTTHQWHVLRECRRRHNDQDQHLQARH
jgi:hypothetical protein